MISEVQLADWERRCGDYDFCENEAYKIVPALIAEVRRLQAEKLSIQCHKNGSDLSVLTWKGMYERIEKEADWLAGHHGTDCVQYIDPHWACRDDKSCDDCWREASKIKTTEQKK